MLTTKAAALASTVAPANVAYHRRLVRRQRITFLLLVAPALLWFMTFMLWPLVNMFYISTTHWDGLAHVSYGGKLYNGYPASTISADGAASHTVQVTGQGAKVGLSVTPSSLDFAGWTLPWHE